MTVSGPFLPVIPASGPESAVQGRTNVAHGDGTPLVRDQKKNGDSV
jgi:hypothetical protein